MGTVRDLLRGCEREYELLRLRARRNFRTLRSEARAILVETLRCEYDNELSEHPPQGAEPESHEPKEQ